MENGRIVALEVLTKENTKDIERNTKEIEGLKKDQNLIHKMNVLLEVQINEGKNQRKQVEGFQELVKSVNDNLTILNYNQRELGSKLDRVVKQVDDVDNRVDKYKEEYEKERKVAKEEDTISIKMIIGNIFKWFAYSLPIALLGAILIPWLVKVLGG